MNRAGAALAIVLAACSVDHGPAAADAAGADAGGDGHVEPMRDVGVDAWFTDAFCPDADGDGARDAACGGDDCDDTDATLGPTHSVCTGPVSIRHCVGAMRVEEACPTAMPDCDARTGVCAVTACGDAVVQPDEQCDDGDPMGVDICDAQCRQVCYHLGGCTGFPDTPSCVPGTGSAQPHCERINPGGAELGARCAVSTECASSWCDPIQGRCSVVSTNTADCVAAIPCWSSVVDLNSETTRARERAPNVCEFACEREADCPPTSGCAIVIGSAPDGTPQMYSACREGPGTAAFGEACGSCESTQCVGGLCTEVCVDDSDCRSPLPHCLEARHTVLASRPAPPWSTPWPRLCQP